MLFLVPDKPYVTQESDAAAILDFFAPPKSAGDEAHLDVSTAGQVTVLLLADDVITLPGQGTQTRIGVYPLRMHWAQGDWKILQPDTATSYRSLAAAPGSPQAAASGWQELTQ